MFSDISHIEFDMAGCCNLACTYCYLEGRNVNQFLSENTVDKFFKLYLATKNIDPHPMVSFWGGEPLLNFNIIKYIVKLFNEEVNNLDP